MNFFVADPHWSWWIILYFYVGGIAAGAYFMATLIDFVGSEADQKLSCLGYAIAFPLILLCGLFLTVDLDRPERFWHMLLKSEVASEAIRDGWPWTGRSWPRMAQAPLLKHWSPMSVGSWALALFGLCSGLSLLGSLWAKRRGTRWSRRGVLQPALQLIGCSVGFFVASYTGALLTATNQPLWSDSVWIAPLFLTSAASTGIATLIVLTHWRATLPAESLRRLERTDHWVLWLELVVFVVFLAGLGTFLVPVLRTWQGQLLVVGTTVLGLIVPLGIHILARNASAGRLVPESGLGLVQALPLPERQRSVAAAVFALLGGFALRYALLTTPPELLAQGPVLPGGESRPEVGTPAALGIIPHYGPEDGRLPGDLGADPGNRPADFHPRSKLFRDP